MKPGGSREVGELRTTLRATGGPFGESDSDSRCQSPWGCPCHALAALHHQGGSPSKEVSPPPGLSGCRSAPLKCALRLAAGRDCNLRTMPSVSKQHICAKRRPPDLRKRETAEEKERRRRERTGVPVGGPGDRARRPSLGCRWGPAAPDEPRPAPRPPRLHPTGKSTARPLRKGKLQPGAHGGRPVPRPGRGAAMKGRARRGVGPRWVWSCGAGPRRGAGPVARNGERRAVVKRGPKRGAGLPPRRRP
ncbi:uncharacterized protein LOC106992799 isoform X2 [Macaca mulatta]